jgi:hypothetical protein
MKNRIAALAASLALGGSLLLMSGGAVAAAGPTARPNADPSGRPVASGVCATERTAVRAGSTVETLRALGDCEINRRFATLNQLAAKITGSKVLTSSDAAALATIVNTTRSGLTALKSTIDSETDLTQLKADVSKIATDYRVYLLVVPQVHLVIGADGVVAAQARFAKVNTNLAARIATAKAAGKDTTAAQAALDAMNSKVAAAVALATPIPGKILPLTPAGYNAGTAGPVITAARADLVTARNDIKAAIASAKACRDALKALGA